MPPLGLMTYGYDEGSAKNVQSMLEAMLGSEIVIIGASNKDDTLVSQILEEGPNSSTFEDHQNKMLMLLGFDDEQVKILLKNFPKKERPIFCGLTDENIKWDMKYLMKHLLEEKKYWESQGKRN